ncbi:MAG: hypothetical protein P4L81_00375 [Candidatus Pacebacteria bacterium]|nr:hypothetical protein [Candidatus Paceibacterota bacterium]
MKLIENSFSHTDKDNVQGEKNTHVTGQGGTKILTKWDSKVPSIVSRKPHDSKASKRDSHGPLVPVISNEPLLMSRSLSNALSAKLSSAYECARAKCVALCDRVLAKDMRVRDLQLRYPREFNSYRNMVQRATDLDHYVCNRWKDGGFVVFLRDKGPIPIPRWTLDRVDPRDPEYSPDKTHWASKRVQTRNRMNTVLIVDAKGVARTPAELAKHSKGRLKADTIRKNKRRGWTDTEVIEGRPRARLPQVATPDSIPALPTAFKAAKSPNELADRWESTMHELKPDETAPLTGKERGRLREFDKYLVEADLHFNKTEIVEFILRNWVDACQNVLADIGWSKAPAKPSPDFIANHARPFVNYVKTAYKREEISKLQFANDDKPNRPERKPAGAPSSNKKQPKGDIATLEEILADPREDA